jgi:hypothetical protein
VTEAAGRATYDGDAAAACLAGFADRSCKDAFGSRTVDPLADCALFRGEVADGDTCVVPYECRSGSARLRSASPPAAARVCRRARASAAATAPCASASLRGDADRARRRCTTERSAPRATSMATPTCGAAADRQPRRRRRNLVATGELGAGSRTTTGAG